MEEQLSRNTGWSWAPGARDGRTTSHTPHLCTGCASLLLTPTCDANGSVLKPDNHSSSTLALSVPGLWIQAVPDLKNMDQGKQVGCPSLCAGCLSLQAGASSFLSFGLFWGPLFNLAKESYSGCEGDMRLIDF